MFKTLTYILLFIFTLSSFSPNFQGVQLLKMPNFLSHFNKHQIENNEENFSIWEFIKEHYLKKDNNSQEEHHKLPFKNNLQNDIPINYVNNQLKPIVFKIYSLIQPKLFSVSPNFFKSICLFSIWNPPRI